MTIESWVRLTNVSSNQYFVAKNNAYGLGINSAGKLIFSLFGVQTYVSANGPTVNAWTHLAASFDGSGVTFYIDGVQKDTVAGIHTVPTSTNAVILGKAGIPFAIQPMAGSLDEVAIYATALSATRIAAHYSGALQVDVPANITAPKISGEVAVGDSLAISDGSWTYRPTFTRQWRRCNAAGASCVDVAGATGATYVVVSADVGRTIRAVVTATNAAGSSSLTSAQTRIATVNRIRDQAAYDLAVLPDNPYAYWPLDESSGTQVNDRSGNNHPLTVNVRGSGGTPAWGYASPAIDATALRMRGNPNSFSAGDQVAGDAGIAGQFMDNFTAETWVRPETSASTYAFLIGYGQPYRCCSTNGWTLMMASGQLSVAIGGSVYGWGAVVPAKVWTHVALTRTNGTWRIFMNGRVIKTFTQTATAYGGTRLWLGNDDYTGGGPGFKGEIANAAVYASALSETRLAAHYRALAPAVLSTKQAKGIPGKGQGLAVNPTGYHADPVNTATGSFFTESTDLELSGTGVPFSFTRTYNSADARVGRFGRGWSDNLDWSVTIEADGGAIVRAGDGQELHYTKLADGSFAADGGGRATLAATGTTGYELVTVEQIHYLFDSQGRLLSVKDRNAQGLTLTYNASGLASVTDSSGRTVTVTIASGRVTGATLPAGTGSVGFAYTNGLLTSVTDVRGGITRYTYDAGNRLATIIDQRNVTVLTNTYDATTGRVVDQADSGGKHTAFAWDATNQVSTVTDPNGKVWKDYYADSVLIKQEPPTGDATTYTRDGDLNLVAVAGPSLEQTAMSYDASGNLLSATAPPSLGGTTKTYTYDAQNNVQSITDGLGNVTTYTYDAAGDNTSISVNSVQVASYTYNASGQRLTETDGRNNITTYTYDARDRVLTKVDPLGNVAGATPADFTTSYTYDAAGHLLTETDQLGNTTTHTYDAVGNLLTKTDANGRTTTYAYDGEQRLLSMTGADPDGGGPLQAPLTSYAYDNVGNKLTETDPRSNTTSHTYDSNNRLASVTTPLGNKTTYFYDSDGNQTKVVEPRGNVSGANPDDYATTSTYDAAGRLLSETNPLGQTTTYTYDKVGNQLTVTDPRGKVTTNSYDGRNRLLSVTAPDGGVNSYTYDANGNQLTRTDPRGKTWTSTYDLANRLSSSTTPLGNKTTYFHDANGRQTKVVEPRGNVAGANPDDYATVSTYDRAGRLLTSTDPLGNQTRYSYDGVGNKLSVTDASDRMTSYTYDPANRLASVIAADLTATSYAYDLAGNLTSHTDANNHTTTYAYDADGRRTTVTSSIGQTWTTSYDNAGNPTQTVDANGNATQTAGDNTTTNTYDRAGRLTEIDYSDATPDVSFAYDAAGNRTTMTDGAGAETRSYDDANRLTQVTRSADTFAYVYDTAGNLTRRTYPGGTITDYTFDDESRMASATSGGATTTYAYDPAANLIATTLPASNGHVETRTYDRSGRLANLKNAQGSTVTSEFAYTLDAVGDPLEVVRTGSEAGTTTYGYDVRNRLTSVCFQLSCPDASDPYIRWTYDAVGNRLTESRPASTTSYAYNAADQMTQAGSTTYGYDANGNQVTAGSDTFTWDLANRLTSTVQGSTTVTYSYNGDGGRVQASTGTSATIFLWDVNHSLPQVALERNGSGMLEHEYIYGVKRIRQSVSSASYYLYDPLGSVSDLSAASGEPQRAWSYEPYGTIRSSTGTEPTNSMQFGGEYQDPTGLYNLRARLYDPTTGRFLAPDPAASPMLPESTYIYASDRPSVLNDPSGLRPQAIKAVRSTVAFTTSPASGSGRDATAIPSFKYFSLPNWQNLGFLWGGAFIMGENACVPIAGCLRGDGRGFSHVAGPAAYRAYVRFDFASGLGMIRINPTCTASGRCKSARPISDDLGSDNLVVTRRTERSFELAWMLRNSVQSFAPTIDGKLKFDRGPDGTSARLINDAYPSWELYRRPPTIAGAHSGPQCIFQIKQAASPAALVGPTPFLSASKNKCGN